ncbi:MULTISPECIES: hypothetical protein [unclassified Streptomyces]|uniref:hypothetical protein n=1 Tax=unclassified Streptomyces TaxID=2593676 RepID=UPI002E2D7D65|nr:hypothetical protein [Streptomyces sp. NBC_00223]
MSVLAWVRSAARHRKTAVTTAVLTVVAASVAVTAGSPAGAVTQATHTGLTWRVLDQRANGEVHVGGDSLSDAYTGDTPASASLPVLCLYVNGSAAPSDITPDFYDGWARGWVGLTPAVSGTSLNSRAAADALCAANFGAGWREAEFHDGRYGSGLASAGGWSFWANGAIPSGTRFWTAISDQPANPWN